MVRNIHDSEIIGVQELQSTTSQSKVSENNELSGWRPEQVVEGLSLELLQESRRLTSIYLVETNADVSGIPMNNGEFRPNRLPSKRLNRFLNFNRVDRNLLFSHMEYFKVVVHSWVLDFIFVFLYFGVAVYFDTEVVSTLLPVDLAVSYREQVLGPYFRAVGKLEECYPSGYILVFRYPICYCIVCRWPTEVSVDENRNISISDNYLNHQCM